MCFHMVNAFFSRLFGIHLFIYFDNLTTTDSFGKISSVLIQIKKRSGNLENSDNLQFLKTYLTPCLFLSLTYPTKTVGDTCIYTYMYIYSLLTSVHRLKHTKEPGAYGRYGEGGGILAKKHSLLYSKVIYLNMYPEKGVSF